MRKKLLIDVIVFECGHNLQVWTEDLANGGWELHARAPCELCGGVVEDISHDLFPTTKVKHVD